MSTDIHSESPAERHSSPNPPYFPRTLFATDKSLARTFLERCDDKARDADVVTHNQAVGVARCLDVIKSTETGNLACTAGVRARCHGAQSLRRIDVSADQR